MHMLQSFLSSGDIIVANKYRSDILKVQGSALPGRQLPTRSWLHAVRPLWAVINVAHPNHLHSLLAAQAIVAVLLIPGHETWSPPSLCASPSNDTYPQVLGGAGPAIAAVPLTAIWAGGSVVTVAASLATAQLGPLAATQRVGYVALASLSQARPW